MGGRVSRAIAATPRTSSPAAAPRPTPPPDTLAEKGSPVSVERPNREFQPFHEPLEHRDPTFEKQLYAFVDRIESVDTVFVEGSDPQSAEAKRKRRREVRQRMLLGRLTTLHFKEILTKQNGISEAQRDAWLAQMASRYEVDPALLAQALRFYRFPKLGKRYDGYLTADLWD